MLTTERIGDVAGTLWSTLRRKNGKGCTVSELKKTKGCTPDEALAAIGWLAREGKVNLEAQGRKMVFHLIEEDQFV